MTGTTLPEAALAYLSNAALTPLWAAARGRLERNRLLAKGTVKVFVDDEGADVLAGLLTTPVTVGEVSVRLDKLDARLRESAAQAGLATVIEAITKVPLQDRTAAREQAAAVRALGLARIDAALAGAGLAYAAWVPAFVAGVQQAGLLTRAGEEYAARCADRAGAVLTALGTRTNLSSPDPWSPGPGPVWELAELASLCTGTAHGLDDGTLTSALVLRAASAAFGEPVPVRATARRALWERLGVVTDVVSGTVLTWNLRPPGTDPWSRMMQARADLSLVTHLTVHEMRAAGAGTLLASSGTVVSVCENPQVLQAAARAAVPGLLICLSGNPASAGVLALNRLIAAGNDVRYHGDFDWPGVAIAGRVLASGATPWRLAANDYEAAANSLPADETLALEGKPVPTPWDPALAVAMTRQGVAVHEESLLKLLLSDLV